MGTALDALSAPPLNIRRPAAPTLPSFELPPPPFTLGTAPAAPKYGHPTHPPASHAPVNASVGNLLTPPATIQTGEHATPQPLAPSTVLGIRGKPILSPQFLFTIQYAALIGNRTTDDGWVAAPI
ncbi:hypothetical protein ACN38_g2785 [Penicillium nordicum]|uniref:Uncharacterized protein n=1 Tax=Penicillium nordicum TaxID=229535 RepID=A0A0M9WIP6_9EURO|nr:hypothetical protein ACN38_g2785 [Penicillium nordicum]